MRVCRRVEGGDFWWSGGESVCGGGGGKRRWMIAKNCVGLLDNLVFGHRWERDAVKSMDVKDTAKQGTNVQVGRDGRI